MRAKRDTIKANAVSVTIKYRRDDKASEASVGTQRISIIKESIIL